MLNQELKKKLVNLAFEARDDSYAPYSRFKVGAAIISADGRTFTGANIENASYGATICAERTVAVKAASSGARQFIAIAITGFSDDVPPEERDYAFPCGICRQVLREFLPESGDIAVFVALSPEDVFETTLNALLPHSFGPEYL
ncbi:MAG: cytidine deaminase [Clostridiaceae bacterium]|jgi:cytidine deaminase|nr:cytidine deaminase [Clostridiaceae bacterium]